MCKKIKHQVLTSLTNKSAPYQGLNRGEISLSDTSSALEASGAVGGIWGGKISILPAI